MREHSITIHGNKFGINPKGELGTLPAAVLNKIIVHAQAVAQKGWPDMVTIGESDYFLDYDPDGAVNFGNSRTSLIYSLDELKRIQKLSRAVKGHRTNKQNKPKVMIQLGDEVKDTVSGLIGIAIGRTEWYNGCTRYVVQPKADVKKGTMPEAVSIDEPQLSVVTRAKVKSLKAKTDSGGPIPVPQRGNEV